MDYLDIADLENINETFCKEVGIQKKSCYIRNRLTGEIRYYKSKKSTYKKPKGWNDIEVVNFNEPRYPNMLDPYNFMILLNVHWYLFGSLGSQYRIVNGEDFETNYLNTRIKAVQLCKSLGGGELLNMYISEIQNMEFDYAC